MRVLRISHSGTVAAWRGRERALRDLEVDVDLLAARSWHAGGVEVRLDAAEEERTTGVRTWGRHPALFVYDPRALWRALGGRWDVLDIHEEPFALATAEILLLKSLRRVRTPYVLYTAQNLRKKYPVPFRWFERAALRHAAGVSACNRDAARIVEEKGFPGRARVIPLGIDPAGFAPPAASRSAPDGRIVVGFIGRLVPEKGVTVLLDAAAHESRLHLRIAGAGPMADEITALASARGVAARVQCVGPVDPQEVAEFYRSVDVLAVPSVPTSTWTEQFGRVAVEAMSCGVPVVASDAGALPEVVGGAGIIVAHGDAAALAAALTGAAGPQREELREAGLARARECSWSAVAGRYLELYRSAAGHPARDPSSRDPSDEKRSVEVVVVAYGAPGLLRRALESVAGLPTTVVDNSSLDEIAELCTAMGARYIDPGDNLGFGGAVNLALAALADSDAEILLVNPDASISADQVAVLHAALRADSRLASVGPAQRDAQGSAARVEWPFPSPLRAWLEAVGLGRVPSRSRFVIGSVLMLRSEALAQVGGFDERFFLYAEEADWAYRAHLLGWRHRVVHEAQALHVGAATSTDPVRREQHFHASQERFLRKHYGALGWQTARVAIWAGAAVRSLLLTGARRKDARRRAGLYWQGPVRVERAMTTRAAR